MLDFHSHLLPGIDDGSDSVALSLQMLRESARQGVSLIVATPHFYANHTSPAAFLEKRRLAWERLSAQMEPGLPEVWLGAEVRYFEGAFRLETLLPLCIENTSLLLLEMPFTKWSPRMLDFLIEMNGMQGLHIVLAHIERYLHDQPRETWHLLRQNGISMQSNAEFFLAPLTRRKAMRMLEDGMIDFLGSDCHNMDDRKPNLGSAAEKIKKKLGRTTLTRLDLLGRDALNA